MDERFAKVAIIGGLRTPFAKADTTLASLDAVELGRLVVTELLNVYDLRGDDVDTLVMGNIAQPAYAPNVARVIALRSGLATSTPAHTVNRNCASGLESILDGARQIALGEARLVIAGGTESMSQIPLLYPESYRRVLFGAQRARSVRAKVTTLSGIRPSHFKPIVGLECGLTDPIAELNMGETAEVLAKEFGIDRETQDRFALRSHERAVAAQQAGRYDEETIPVYVPDRYETALRLDNGPRENQSMEALARLRPIFDRTFGTVTAGNACPITDGAAALLLADTTLARERGWPVLGTIRAHATRGIEPERMGLGPVLATAQALERAHMTMEDLDLVELNEAFAVQVLACEQAFASSTFAAEYLGRSRPVGTLPMDRLNVNGGAIALGHPVGVSGTRLVLTALLELRRRGLGTALATLCVGGGQGAAVILETPEA